MLDTHHNHENARDLSSATLVRRDKLWPKLGFVEALVDATRRNKLLVSALLRDPCLVHHDDSVGVLDRGEAVGDDKGGATDGELGE